MTAYLSVACCIACLWARWERYPASWVPDPDTCWFCGEDSRTGVYVQVGSEVAA